MDLLRGDRQDHGAGAELQARAQLGGVGGLRVLVLAGGERHDVDALGGDV